MRGVRRSRRQLSRSNSSTPVSSLDYFDFGASKQSALASESQVSGSQVSEPKASEPVASSEPASVTPTDENSLLRVVEVESRPAKRRRLLHSASSELFDLSSKESFLVRRDGESQESYTTEFKQPEPGYQYLHWERNGVAVVNEAPLRADVATWPLRVYVRRWRLSHQSKHWASKTVCSTRKQSLEWSLSGSASDTDSAAVTTASSASGRRRRSSAAHVDYRLLNEEFAVDFDFFQPRRRRAAKTTTETTTTAAKTTTAKTTTTRSRKTTSATKKTLRKKKTQKELREERRALKKKREEEEQAQRDHMSRRLRAMTEKPVLSSASKDLLDGMSNWTERYLGCAVCGDTQGYSENALVGCSGCDIFVHLNCYGLESLPKGTWYCEWCQMQNKKLSGKQRRSVRRHGQSEARCVLCPVRGGAVVRVAECAAFPHTADCAEGEGDAWVHVGCALYLDEVFFWDPVALRRPAVDYTDAERLRHPCGICKSKVGAMVRCDRRSCKRWFHTMCAKRHPEAGYKALMSMSSSETRKLLRCQPHFSLPSGRASARKRQRGGRRAKADELVARPEPEGPLLAASPRARRMGATRNPWLLHEVLQVRPRGRVCLQRDESLSCGTLHGAARLEYRADQTVDQTVDRTADQTVDQTGSGSEDGAGDPTWHVVHTTDADSRVVFQASALLAPRWGLALTDVKASNERTRTYRKVVGYSALIDHGGEMMACAQWSVWTVSHNSCALNVQFFLTKEKNSRGVSQRRKKNGTLLMAHILRWGFARPEIRFCIVASEQGGALSFWQAIGFRYLTRREKNTISTVEIAELDPYNDTVTLIMTDDEYAAGTHTVQSVEASFDKWHRHHRRLTRTLTVTRAHWAPLEQRHVRDTVLQLRADLHCRHEQQRLRVQRLRDSLVSDDRASDHSSDHSSDHPGDQSDQHSESSHSFADRSTDSTHATSAA